MKKVFAILFFCVVILTSNSLISFARAEGGSNQYSLSKKLIYNISNFFIIF